MIHKNYSEDGYGLINLRLGGAHLRVLATKSATTLIPYLYHTWYRGRNLGSRDQISQNAQYYTQGTRVRMSQKTLVYVAPCSLYYQKGMLRQVLKVSVKWNVLRFFTPPPPQLSSSTLLISRKLVQQHLYSRVNKCITFNLPPSMILDGEYFAIFFIRIWGLKSSNKNHL